MIKKNNEKNRRQCFAAGVQSFTSARRHLAQRVKLQNDPRAAPSIVTQPFFLSALSTDFTLRRLLDAARLPGRTEWAQLHRFFFFSTLRGENLRKGHEVELGALKEPLETERVARWL